MLKISENSAGIEIRGSEFINNGWGTNPHDSGFDLTPRLLDDGLGKPTSYLKLRPCACVRTRSPQVTRYVASQLIARLTGRLKLV